MPYGEERGRHHPDPGDEAEDTRPSKAVQSQCSLHIKTPPLNILEYANLEYLFLEFKSRIRVNTNSVLGAGF